MQVSGAHVFKASRHSVWSRLLDLDTLSGCMPGCRQFEHNGPDRYDVVLKVGIGAIKGMYAGTVSIREVDEPVSFRMLVDGECSGGAIRGEVVLALVKADRGRGDRSGAAIPRKRLPNVYGPVTPVCERSVARD